MRVFPLFPLFLFTKTKKVRIFIHRELFILDTMHAYLRRSRGNAEPHLGLVVASHAQVRGVHYPSIPNFTHK